MISGRCAGSIRCASRMSSMHSSECRLMLETMNTSGIRPSSRICDGRKLRFHCCSTIRVFANPASASADPMARTPAGIIRVSAKMNGSIRVRWSNAQAITVDEVVLARPDPQPLPQTRQFAGLEQLVAACASGEFHVEPLLESEDCPPATASGLGFSGNAGRRQGCQTPAKRVGRSAIPRTLAHIVREVTARRGPGVPSRAVRLASGHVRRSAAGPGRDECLQCKPGQEDDGRREGAESRPPAMAVVSHRDRRDHDRQADQHTCDQASRLPKARHPIRHHLLRLES